MRLRQKPWADKELAENPMLIPQPKDLKAQWHTLFNNQNPIHLEIGCGKGKFILENAIHHPNINFLAMEKFEKIICMALRGASLAGLPPNLHFFCEDANNITDFFSEGELSRIYINFCDPWRARGKWRRRRLTHRDFLTKYESIMATKEIHFKTDNILLFDFSVTEFQDCGWQLRNLTYDLHNSGHASNVRTEYEEKFAANGLNICRLEAYK